MPTAIAETKRLINFYEQAQHQCILTNLLSRASKQPFILFGMISKEQIIFAIVMWRWGYNLNNVKVFWKVSKTVNHLVMIAFQ